MQQTRKRREEKRESGRAKAAVVSESRNRRIEEKATKLRKRRAKIARVKISHDRHDYIISNEDYKRGLPKENDYLRKHKANLFRLFA